MSRYFYQNNDVLEGTYTDTQMGRRNALVTACQQYLVVKGNITGALSELLYNSNYS